MLLFSKLLKGIVQNIYVQYKHFRIYNFISLLFWILTLSHIDTAIFYALAFIDGMETLAEAELQFLI